MNHVNTYEKGSIIISDNVIHMGGTTINMANIDNMTTFVYAKRSYLENLGDWFKGLIFILIIYAIWNELTWLPYVYLIFGIGIIICNIMERKKNFYGMKIQTSRKTVYFKSENQEFIFNLHDAIVQALNQKNVNYTINMDDHSIINGVNKGILNTGENTENRVINEN